MKTTLNIEDNLIEKATIITGIKEKTNSRQAGIGSAYCQRKRTKACKVRWNSKTASRNTEKKRSMINHGSCGHLRLGFAFEEWKY